MLQKRVAQLILSHPKVDLEPLGEFLTKEFMSIEKSSWSLLSLSEEDWSTLRTIREISETSITNNYLSLTLQYIQINAIRIRSLYDIEKTVSHHLIHDQPEEAATTVASLDKYDIHSLFASRLTAALNSHDTDQLLKLFSSKAYTDWFRIRFLYPFVYYFVVTPPDSLLDHHLSYAIPPGHDNEIERAAIRFLLRDEVCFSETLAFKCYLALATHPYDACEILLNHCKLIFSREGHLGDLEHKIIATLETIIPSWKRDFLFELMKQEPIELTTDTNVPRLCNILCMSPTLTDFFTEYLSLVPMSNKYGSIESETCLPLYRVREQRYPPVADYQTLVSLARRYRFIVFGKALKVILASLYMFPRKTVEEEIYELIELTSYVGCFSTFVATSPRAHTALKREFILVKGKNASQVIRSVSETVIKTGQRDDRIWVKQIQWRLMEIEATGKVGDWLNIARFNIDIAPSYISGIDWGWVDDVIAGLRIGPFRGNAAGVYVLFLELLEEPHRGTNRLRIAIEPIAQSSKKMADLLQWLITEYGEDAIAFVRFFLSGDLIMKLRLVDNYTAAISERIAALEVCAKRFKLQGPLLTEEILAQEQQAFTASLIRINVGTNQFEVSWDVLVRDILADHSEEFRAFSVLAKNPVVIDLLSLRSFSFLHQFSIGENREYRTTYTDWAFVSVILATIDGFMKHPSQGIESILSIRIRHGLFEREVLASVKAVRNSRSTEFRGSDLRTFVPFFETDLRNVIQHWLDRFMHQRRPDKPDAIFTFTPSQEEFDELIQDVKKGDTAEEAVRVSVGYLRTSLNSQLIKARTSLINSLYPTLCESIERTRLKLERDKGDIGSLQGIGGLLKSALKVRIEEIQDWFHAGQPMEKFSASLDDIGATVAERYKEEVDRSHLRICSVSKLPVGSLQGHHIRLVYDLWCEAVANAIVHSGLKRSYIRVSTYEDEQVTGLLFSSLCVLQEPIAKKVAGHPYQSMSAKLFREGESGLEKIASLAASVAEQEIEVRVVQKKHSFHIIVPLSPKAAI